MTVSEGFKIDSAAGSGLAFARRPLIWLNCLCLDAPLVAVSWQMIFARGFHYQLTAASSGALFLTAWWIYLADRVADSLTLQLPAPSSARAVFCLRHRRELMVALIIIGLADAAIVLSNLSRAIFSAGTILGLFAVLYLFLNLRSPRLWQFLPVKELSVGFLFALGTTLAFWSDQVSTSLVVAVFLFGCVCSLNCLSIAFWERNLDLGQGKYSYATEHPGHAWLVRLGCLVSTVVACALGERTVLPPLVGATVATSSACLLLLHFIDVRPDERTALADMALLFPAVLFLVPGLW